MLISRYDTEGLRYELEENECLVKFIFHKANVLVETDAKDQLISRFARGYEVVGAEIRNEDSDTYSTYYYHPDEQGSTLYITDETAIIKNYYFYDAEGNLIKHVLPESYDSGIDDGKGYTYSYNAMNQLVKVVNPESITETTYVYDLNGNLIE